MKIFGLLFFLVGLLLGCVSLFLDTTNGTGFNNIGLLFSKFENITIAACFILSGIILFCTASITEELKNNKTACSDDAYQANDGKTHRKSGIIEQKVKSFGEKLNDYQIK